MENIIDCVGNVSFWGGYYTYIQSEMNIGGNLVLQSNQERINAKINVAGNVEIGGQCKNHKYVTMQGGELNVNGDLIVSAYEEYTWAETIIDYQKAANINVTKDVVINTKSRIEGSVGTLTVGGDMSGAGYVSFSGSHKTLFNGTELQKISIASNSTFGTLEMVNVSEEGVLLDYIYQAGTLIRNGNTVKFNGVEGSLGWTLTGDQTVNGDLILIDDTLDLNGHKLTVTGDLIQYSGTIYVNGGSLEVEGDYKLQKKNANDTYTNSTGVLKMTNDDDYVLVKGNYYNQSTINHTGYLTAGTMEVKGNFTVERTETNPYFVASGSHTLVLSGDNGQEVYLGYSRSGANRINNLAIENNSEEGVTFKTFTDGTWPTATGIVKDNNYKTNGYLAIIGSTSYTWLCAKKIP